MTPPTPRTEERGTLTRFTFAERVVHWVVGLSFVYLLFTGLALSHPRLYWITAVVGGGQTARWLHPWVGVLFSVGLVAMVWIWARDMRIDATDRRWLASVRHYALRQEENVPPAGKYNGGQKLFFWASAGLGVAFLLSGLPIWMPDGFFGLGPFYGAVVNLMRLVHYAATVGGGLLLIVHVYLGTVAYPGTLGAMLHGSVSRSWARLHHRLWYEERTRS